MRRPELRTLEVPLGALGAALVVLAFVFAVTGIPSWIPPALTVRAGIPSPLTGMTRSFVALASGDLGAAFAWHPLGPLVFAASVGAVVVAGASWARGSRIGWLAALMRRRWFWAVVTIAFAAAWARQIAASEV